MAEPKINPEIPTISSSVLEGVRTSKETGGVHDDITKIEDQQLKDTAGANLGSVALEGWGTFFKLQSGGWRGPGGNYGPTTELGRKLESAFANQQQSQEE